MTTYFAGVHKGAHENGRYPRVLTLCDSKDGMSPEMLAAPGLIVYEAETEGEAREQADNLATIHDCSYLEVNTSRTYAFGQSKHGQTKGATK